MLKSMASFSSCSCNIALQVREISYFISMFIKTAMLYSCKLDNKNSNSYLFWLYKYIVSDIDADVQVSATAGYLKLIF